MEPGDRGNKPVLMLCGKSTTHQKLVGKENYREVRYFVVKVDISSIAALAVNMRSRPFLDALQPD